MTFRRATALAAAIAIVAFGSGVAASWAASIGAAALLHPARTSVQTTPPGCVNRSFRGEGVVVRGWDCAASGPRRGALVYLHGVADNRTGASGVIRRFTRRGLDVVAYDSRAHGESGGDVCTYGFYEKQDLRRVVAALPPGPVVLIGTSLGGAVALQAAANDQRISGVVAAEVFSDLTIIVRERAPRFTPDGLLRDALRTAGERGRFDVEQVSPVRAAASIRVPVLLVHGAADIDTTPAHSQRVLNALNGPKRLILVNGARHNESLRDAGVWSEIEQWIDEVLR
jgi:pimeloyl-ACP methyl ester carboxylesterase